MSVTALPEQLTDAAARDFASRMQLLLIGGERVSAASGETFETFDPATGLPITSVALAGPEDVDAAVRAARGALNGEWGRLPAAGRAHLLHKLADAIEAHGEELAQLESLDNGKPVHLARFVDIGGTVAWFRHFAGWAERIFGETIPVAFPDMHVYTRKEPVGVCGQIIPWNFPLTMAAWKLCPALAAGCTVVLKPAEQTPLTALRLGELALQVGFPEGVINVVTGDGATGAAIVDHPGVDKIAFTGSTDVGREIGAKCGRTLKRVTLELGGKSPNIILPDADLDAAIPGAFQALYFNSGQVCAAGSRLFVHKSQFDEVVSALAQTVSQSAVGPGLDESTQLGPVVSAEQQQRVQSFIDSGLAEGAERVAGGKAPEGDGYYVPPTLFTATDDDISIARDEIFGPVLVALPYESLEEVADRANASEYGLAAGIWTRDIGNAHRLAALIKAGTVFINTYGLVEPGAPFGGYKSSGIGREHGRIGIESYLETKTVWTSLA